MDVIQYEHKTDEQRKEMWNEIAEWLALSKSERQAHELWKKKQDVMDYYGIPQSTFYWKIQQEDMLKDVVKRSLVKAKKFIPEVIAALEKNVYEGKEKSIEMYLKYIAEAVDRIDHTTKGEKIETSVILTPEQRKRIAEEELKN